MSDLSPILPVLKYGGAIVAMVYGLYATLADFKDERNGKKVLTTKGYFGIALLVFSSVLSFCSDIAKDAHDQKDADADKRELESRYQQVITNLTETKEQLVAQNETLRTALEKVGVDVARVANPIKELAFSFVYTVPRDKKVEDYRKRLEDERPNLANERFPKGVSWTHVNTEVRISNDSPLFPQPSEIASEVVTSPLILAFYRAPWNSNDAQRMPDLNCDLTRRGEFNDGRAEVWYNLKTGNLRIARFKISKYKATSNGKIAAISDLANCGLRIFFENQHPATDSAERVAAVNDLRRRIAFENLDLLMAGGRSIRVDGGDLKRPIDSDHLDYIFPSNLQ
jgi:hypothetical protein